MRPIITLLPLTIFISSLAYGQITIGDGTPPHPSAMFEIKSTTKGFLLPRMSSFQRTNIGSPAQGLEVYDTDTNTFWYYNGSAWIQLALSGGGGTNYWSLGNAGSIYNKDAFKILMGTDELGPGYVNIKLPLNLSGLFLSETGTNTADFISFGTYSGGGTTSTRFGNMNTYFGQGFAIANQTGPLMFNVAAGERIRITPSGYVGIGTQTPTNALEVKTAVQTPGITHTDGTIRLSTMINSSNAAIGTTTNHHLFFFTNNQINTAPPAMIITNTGNVSVGGSIPTDKFEVFTPDAAYGMTQSSAGGISMGTYIGGGAGWLGTKTNHPLLLFASTGASFVALTQAGKFGIGTTTPPEKLTVQTSTNNYGLIHTDGNVSVGTYTGGSNLTGGWVGTKSNHPLMFFTNNGSELMTIRQNGNVGIGTNNPTYKLSVNGTVQSKEVRVQTGWADFVFEKDYQLRSLPEVEQFIIENKHLPGIPSAHEIQTNGLALGESQTKMMQKIEELTIYLIQANKTIEELKQRIDQLEKANK